MTNQERFERFDAANPHVYAQFCFFTHQLIETGKKFSAGLIFERVRWESLLSTSPVNGEEYKLDDRYEPYYARKFMKDHPHLGSVFRTRRIRVR